MARFQFGRTIKWARAHFFVSVTHCPGPGKACGNEFFGRISMDLALVREAAERVARSEGLEILDIEWKVGKQRFLRVYLDRLPGPNNPEGLGVNHNDCQRVSEQLSVILDVEDLVPGPAYILEVSSPGLDRKLVKPQDYERFAGRRAKVWLNEPIEDQKFFEARLAGYSDGVVKLTVKDRELAVPYAAIQKANLVVEF
jgi:ribosome maturation factor RimP